MRGARKGRGGRVRSREGRGSSLFGSSGDGAKASTKGKTGEAVSVSVQGKRLTRVWMSG